MNGNNEKTVKKYFDNHKVEISDNGFTNHVMNKIPQREKKADWIIVVFTFLGMIISVLLLDVNKTFNELIQIISQISYLYIIIFVAAFPIVFLSIYYFIQKEKL